MNPDDLEQPLVECGECQGLIFKDPDGTQWFNERGQRSHSYCVGKPRSSDPAMPTQAMIDAGEAALFKMMGAQGAEHVKGDLADLAVYVFKAMRNAR